MTNSENITKPTINIEQWVIELFNDINQACMNNENYDLHLEASVVDDLADAWDRIKNVEIS